MKDILEELEARREAARAGGGERDGRRNRQVGGRTEFGRAAFREPEVEHLDPAARDHDVVGLDVPVHDRHVVCIGHCIQQGNDLFDAGLRRRGMGGGMLDDAFAIRSRVLSAFEAAASKAALVGAKTVSGSLPESARVRPRVPAM